LAAVATDPEDKTIHSDHPPLFFPDATWTQLSVTDLARIDTDDVFHDWSDDEPEEKDYLNEDKLEM
jgi:hypothetical protein